MKKMDIKLALSVCIFKIFPKKSFILSKKKQSIYCFFNLKMYNTFFSFYCYNNFCFKKISRNLNNIFH